jgi:hypothetical protein
MPAAPTSIVKLWEIRMKRVVQGRRKSTDHNIQSPEFTDCLIDSCLDISFLSNIGLHCYNLCVWYSILDQRNTLFCIVQINVNKKNLCSLLRKKDRGLEADSAAIDPSWGTAQ